MSVLPLYYNRSQWKSRTSKGMEQVGPSFYQFSYNIVCSSPFPLPLHLGQSFGLIPSLTVYGSDSSVLLNSEVTVSILVS